MVSESQRFVRKWNSDAITQKIVASRPTATNVDEFNDYLSYVFRFIESVTERLTDGMHPDDKIRFVLQCRGLDTPISTPLLSVSEFAPEALLAKIERIAQSKRAVILDQELTLHVVRVHLIRGGLSAWNVRHIVDVHEARKRLRCIVQIKVKNNTCLPASLVLGKSLADNGSKGREFMRLRHYRGLAMLEREAAVLYRQVFGHFPNAQRQCSLQDLGKFQNHAEFADSYQIVVFGWAPRRIIWKGPELADPNGKRIFLLYHNHHFDLVTTPAAFVKKSYFCTSCMKGYKNVTDHRCQAVCRGCFKSTCPNKTDVGSICCLICNRVFPGVICHAEHLRSRGQGRPSLCESFQKCPDCGRALRQRNRTAWRNGQHHCGDLFCKSCKAFTEPDHLCYIKTVREDEEIRDRLAGRAEIDGDDDSSEVDGPLHPGDDMDEDLGPVDEQLIREAEAAAGAHVPPETSEVEAFRSRRYVYFDIEAYPDANEEGTHVCNLIVAQDNLSGDEHVFDGANPIEEFCLWALTPANRDTCFIAHNMKRYDGYFVVKWVLENCDLHLNLIANGGQIFLIEVRDLRIRFVDSMNFLSTGLVKLPAMFGLDTSGLRKGFFPHAFNRPENAHYRGAMPALHFYEPEMMNEKRRSEFSAWYQERIDSGYEFRFRSELLAYCRDDVLILRKCCELFRELYFQETTVDPFRCVTIASACNLVFRKLFLLPRTIAIIPPNGYMGNTRQSQEALRWLHWMEHSSGRPIRHIRNGGEVTVVTARGQRLKLDGAYAGTTEGLEFAGCFFHGCPKCYHPTTWNSRCQKKMKDIYEDFCQRDAQLRNVGWSVTVMWECQWKEEMEERPEIEEFLREHLPSDLKQPPLNPRDAFFGGRTNGGYLFYKAQKGEKIKYIDINSLYPYVNKWKSWPIGHPTILTASELDQGKVVDCYFGIICCKILPPRRLWHPVLPVRLHGKQMFPLCRTCAETSDSGPCTHDVRQRALTGTWVSEELKLALAAGYKLLSLYEVWHFEDSSDTLFKGYINKFLRLKQQSRGWPAFAQTPEQKRTYLEDYEAAEGVELVPDEIEENVGLYQVAKVCLNSFWGKFGQRPNLGNIKFINEEDEFWKFILSEQHEITDLEFHGEQWAQLQYKQKCEFVESGITTNIVIAAFTTAYARCHLWTTLNQLGDRCLYWDTDSVIYVSRLGAWDPPLGEFLGEFKDELGQGTYIKELVCAGPKNYGYITQTGSQCLKVRGFTLNPVASEVLNFGTVKQMVLEADGNFGAQTREVNMGTTFCRNKKTWTVTTKPLTKKYKIVYDKRIIMNDFSTVPWGYLYDADD